MTRTFSLIVSLAILVLPSGDGHASGAPTAAEIAALASSESEPAVHTVHAWAVAEAGADRRRAGGLIRAARQRGALPLIRLRGRYQDRSSRRWDDLDLQDQRDKDVDYTLDLWLEWDLAELAAGIDLHRALRENRASTELRHAVITQVNIAYFDRRRLLAEERLSDGAELPERLVLRRLRVQELDATLDGLTGGRWTAALSALPPPRGSSDTPAVRIAREQRSGPQREDPDPGLRLSVHPADRPADP